VIYDELSRPSFVSVSLRNICSKPSSMFAAVLCLGCTGKTSSNQVGGHGQVDPLHCNQLLSIKLEGWNRLLSELLQDGRF
jgi:hypothetical protein